MSNSQIVYNILKPIMSIYNGNSIPSIFYDSQDSILDIVIKQMCDVVVYSSPEYLHQIALDAYWTNNPTQYTTQIDHIRRLHIPDIIYFREHPPTNIKKEDRFLIQNKFAESSQIYRNHAIRQQWGGNSDMMLEYGVPNTILDKTPSKPIVLINTKKQRNLYLLHKQIQQYWQDIDIIDNIQYNSVEDISSKLQEYKLCIAAEDDYNILFGVASGCRVLSNKIIEDCEYLLFNDMEQLLDSISLSIREYQNYDRIKYSQSVIKQYNFDIFSTRIHHYIKQIIRKPVLL